MKLVTEQSLNDLINKFRKYTETAEQHEFIVLAFIQSRIEKTDIKELVKNQEEARAMYRTIAKYIGEDYTDFKEQNNGR